jgi:hypothetical protein
MKHNSKPTKQRTCKSEIYFEESESDLPKNIEENEPFDDDHSYERDNFTDKDVNLICKKKIGRDGEIWYRCICNSMWVHSECSGSDSPKGYTFDLCTKENRKGNISLSFNMHL